jgi:hypothetical protein
MAKAMGKRPAANGSRPEFLVVTMHYHEKPVFRSTSRQQEAATMRKQCEPTWSPPPGQQLYHRRNVFPAKDIRKSEGFDWSIQPGQKSLTDKEKPGSCADQSHRNGRHSRSE